MAAGLDFAWLNAEVLVSGTMPVQTALFLALVWMSNKADRRQYRRAASRRVPAVQAASVVVLLWRSK
ncbi:hypothetical protein K788_00000420 [Paraburkholderia caribensis MBA4]|uniref:Uncharacterized protein n=1 Tax=Paraburkholderia caribensis MBA4 TaxID=1323664 RepID=A0A0P0RJV0_9BURK|nr:hypothetical protein K788_00000420 [Paraburkholderia caribensis MBA4]